MAKSGGRQAIGQKPRGWRGGALAVLVVLALAAAAWNWRAFAAAASVDAAYGARIGCSCRFVAGRSLEDCAGELGPALGAVSLSEDADESRVSARASLLFTQSATFRAGQGCVLDPWEK